MKKSFVLHLDSLVILRKMPDEMAGKFLKIIYQYHTDQTLPEMDLALEMAITPFINQFIRDSEKYTEVSEKRKEAGAKGGKQKVANATNSEQIKANVADSDSDSDSKSDNVNGNRDASELFQFGQYQNVERRIVPKKEEVELYFSQQGKSNQAAIRFFNYQDALGWMKGNSPITNWRSLALNWDDKESPPVKTGQTHSGAPTQTYEQIKAKREANNR